MFKKLLFSGMLILILVIITNAQVPQLINYQAILTDADENPITGTRSIRFSIYDAETDGTELWTETQEIQIEDGLLSVLLGSINPIPYSVFEGDATYLELKIGSDPAMTPRKRLVSVGYAMRANYADHVSGLANDFVETVDGVAADGSGNIDLVEGDNITIEPQPGSNRITISAAGGGTTGDNLGNHRATQNIRLNDHWLSNDGDDEGIQISNSGSLLIPKDITSHGDIITSEDILATNITAISTIQVNGGINVGSPSASAGSGDISVADDILVDDHVLSEFITAYSGWIKTGSPSSSYGNGDICATDEVVADNVIRTGSPSHPHGYGSGDIAATDDLLADNNAYIGNDLIVEDHPGVNAGGFSTTYALYVYGDAYCTGNWLGSDSKLKKNIINIENPMSVLAKLNGVSFNWRTEEFPEREFSEGRHYGLIAQQVEKVLPEIVKTDDKGEKAVAYIELIPLLLEAIKQQQKAIEELQRKVNQ